MADAGIFVGWSQAARGRERQALQVFNEAVEYYSELARSGEIEGFEPVVLEAHGGDLGGFFLLRDEAERLARVRASEEFQRLVQRAGLVVDHFGVVNALLGERVRSGMNDFAQNIEDLT